MKTSQEMWITGLLLFLIGQNSDHDLYEKIFWGLSFLIMFASFWVSRAEKKTEKAKTIKPSGAGMELGLPRGLHGDEDGNDGWIEHGRNPEPPVSPDTLVDIQWANGGEAYGWPADSWEWQQVARYRLAKIGMEEDGDA